MKKNYLKGVSLLLASAIGALVVSSPVMTQPSQESQKTQPTDFIEAIRQAEVISKSQNLFDDPLIGIVINRTVTVQGHEFYRFFTNRWREFSEVNPFTITVFERPSARWGSEIWVEHRGQRMYHVFLSPARSSTKKASEIAVDVVIESINRSEIERLFTNNPDLAPEEF